MSYKVTKELSFCYGHRLLNYKGKCRHLHGHNGRVEIELVSETLDSRGMVIDFEKIKTSIKSWIDKHLDHRMVLSKKDPILKLLKRSREPVYVLSENPTAENIAKLIYRYGVSRGFPVSEVRLWETETSCAVYSESERSSPPLMGGD